MFKYYDDHSKTTVELSRFENFKLIFCWISSLAMKWDFSSFTCERPHEHLGEIVAKIEMEE